LRGILGGGLGSYLLRALTGGGAAASAAGGAGLGNIVSGLAGGGIGGAVLMIVVDLIRSAMASK
jgi:hypothetical protein